MIDEHPAMQDPRKENQNAMAHSSFAILKRIENQPMQGIAPLACLGIWKE